MKANKLSRTSRLSLKLISFATALVALTGTPARAQAQNTPADASWTETGSMGMARHDHTATLLNSDKVVVAGGIGNSGLTMSSEPYDPAEGSWSYTRSLLNRRYDPTATMLLSGKVLVAGGGGTGGLLSSAELYDPATGRWASTGTLVNGRDYHTATLLPSARCWWRAASIT